MASITHPPTAAEEENAAAYSALDAAISSGESDPSIAALGSADHSDEGKGDDVSGSASASASDDDDDDDDVPPLAEPKHGEAGFSVEERIAKALGSKDEGNAHFKGKEYNQARSKYTEALEFVTDLCEDSDDEESEVLSAAQSVDVHQVRLSTRLNLAAACNGLEDWPSAVEHATKALSLDADNAKALYRRGLAHSRLGSLDAAKRDLLKVLKADPKNRGARAEVKALKVLLAEAKEQRKIAGKAEAQKMAGAFDKVSMYDDKEKQRKLKKRKAIDEEKKQRVRWEEYNARRVTASEKKGVLACTLTFEKFQETEKKEKEAGEKKRKKAAEDKRAEERRKREAARKEAGLGEPEAAEIDDDDEAILREHNKAGYCYFNKAPSLSVEGKAAVGNVTPQRVGVKAGGGAGGDAGGAGGAGGGSGGGAEEEAGSAWNKNGTTWEDRDKTDWAKGRLEELLQETKAESGGMEEMMKNIYLVKK